MKFLLQSRKATISNGFNSQLAKKVTIKNENEKWNFF